MSTSHDRKTHRLIWRRRAAAGLATIGIALTALGTGVAPAVAAPGDPFPDDESLIFLSQQTGTTQLYRYMQGPSGFTTTLEGSTPGYAYNAIGYHLGTNYLYAARLGSYGGDLQIVRIGEGGLTETYGTLDGLSNPAPNSVFNQGTFGQGADASTFYLRLTGNNPLGSSDRLYIVDDITDRDPITHEIPWRVLDLGQQVGNMGDLVYLSGYLWGIYGSGGSGPRIVRIDPDPDPGDPFVRLWNMPMILAGEYGGTWIFGNGNLGASHNATGTVFQISIASPSSQNPGFELVATLAGPASQLNDGTSAFQSPVDLGIVKASPSYVPGEAFDFQLTVTNHDTGTSSSGYLVMDEVPAPLTIQSTSAGCETDPANPRLVTCSGGSLAPGASTVHTITVVAPAGHSACITNTAEVLGNENDPVAANDTSTAQSCLHRSTITLQKAWVDAQPGDSAEFEVRSGASASTAVSTAESANEIDLTNTAELELPVGATVELSETLGANNSRWYEAGLSCTGATPVDGQFVVTRADVLCTLTNSSQTITVTLRAEWIDAVDGDASTLTINGAAPTVSEAPDGTGVASVTAYRGSQVSLAETFAAANLETYDVAYTCDIVEPNGTTFIAPATDVACTAINTLRVAEPEAPDGDDPPLASTGSDDLLPIASWLLPLTVGGAMLIAITVRRMVTRRA